MRKVIPVSEPYLDNTEKEFVTDALDKKAISGCFGEYITRFEEGFAAYSDCAHGVSVTSGTTALHLALVTLRVGPGDEVLVATTTNMATFFAVAYQNARPVPIDIEEDTFNLDPALLEAKITPRTKVILVVHLFGHPVDMDPVLAVARKHNLYVVEDCAEAHGATYKGRKVGSLGHIGCFSFYANKILTTGEGGMLTMNDSALAERARSLRSLAFGKTNKFMHLDIGYNYRMTNLQAAIGCAQLGKIEDVIARKISIAEFYSGQLASEECLQLPVTKPYARNVYWMYHLNLRGKAASRREEIRNRLMENGIETREGFIPYNLQEIFIEARLTCPEDCPKAARAGSTSFYLPSSPLLTEEDMEYVATALKAALKGIPE